MAGAYFAAFGYRLYVKKGTTASTVPTSASGLIEVLSLENAGIQGATSTTEVIDYASSQGFSLSLVTGQSYTIPCTMNLDLRDAGYKELKDAALNAATGTTVQWFRESPEMTTTGAAEYHAGVAFVSDFSEDIQSGNVAKVTFTLTGYGAYTWVAETDV